MYRQQSSINRRPKGGIKLRNVIQFGLMVVIGVWLLYQIKHSHDKKNAYEARYLTEVPTEGSKTGKPTRKELAQTVVGEFQGESQGNEGKIIQENEGKEGKVEEIAQKKGENINVEEPVNEETSHEAREKSFKGDDASSEVAHLGQVGLENEEGPRVPRGVEHNLNEVELEEGPHKAREMSFKGDDVSSAVDHVPKQGGLEYESKDKNVHDNGDRETEVLTDEIINDIGEESEDFDTSLKSNSTFVGHGLTDTPLEDDDSNTEQTEVGVVLSELQEKQYITTGKPPQDLVKRQLVMGNVSNINDQTRLLVHSTNSSRERNLLKNQEITQMNHSVASTEKLETGKKDKNTTIPITNAASMQNQTNEKSSLKQVTTHSDIPEEVHVESSNTSDPLKYNWK